MMSGGAGDVVKALKDALFILRRNLEAVIDFPEEPDIDPTVFRWQHDVDQLKANLVQWRQSASRSSSSDVAIKVLLLGPANAGKSSLIRALIPGSQPVISHQAGTTLDLIPYALSSEEGPVHLYDSPGLKVAEGRLDELSLERLMARLPSFDAIIQMADREQWQSVEWPSFDAETPSLQVLSKADQLFQEDEVSEKNEASPENEPFREGTLPENRLQLSSLRGDGLKELKLQLSAWSREWSQKKASPMEALKNRLLDLCADRLTRVDAILLNAWPEEELAAYELDELLDEIDGFSFEEGGSEALLDGIFRDFCIGK
jgi:tRNA modification GTPase